MKKNIFFAIVMLASIGRTMMGMDQKKSTDISTDFSTEFLEKHPIAPEVYQSIIKMRPQLAQIKLSQLEKIDFFVNIVNKQEELLRVNNQIQELSKEVNENEKEAKSLVEDINKQNQNK